MMNRKTFLYNRITRKQFEDFKRAIGSFNGDFLQENRKTPLYKFRSIYLRLIETKCIPMHHDIMEGEDMPTAVTNEHLRKEFDNFENNGDLGNLFEELQYSTLIVPMDSTEEGCAMIEMDKRLYIPLFTDIHEYQKVSFGHDIRPKAFEFNFYLEVLQRGEIEGFIINVESERFPVTKDFLDFMDTDYRFDLDYHPFTQKEIQELYDSIDNTELKDFLNDDESRWDFDRLMDLLLKSDIFSAIVSDDDLDTLEKNGVISLNNAEKRTYFRTGDNYAVLFSSGDKINICLKNYHVYSILVNLGLFIDFVLKGDLEGIIVDEDVVISRDFLMGFMKGFSSPSLDKYDDYAFLI